MPSKKGSKASKAQAQQPPTAAEALEQALEKSQQIIDQGVADGKKQVQKAKQQVTSTTDSERKAFWKKVWDRTLFTFIMIGGFVGLLLMGHPYMILLVTFLETLVYREVVGLFNLPSRPHVTPRAGKSSGAESAATSAAPSDDEDDEGFGLDSRRKEELWSKTLSWYFFAVANYFLYGESLIYYFKHIVFVDAYFLPFASKHRLLSFLLYTFGFVAFVSGLKRANLKRQFGLFCWVHMSLLLIVFSSHFMVNNILEGLIWFWLPASLVICNDVFAYVCGMLFGRTPLISLSPKKTVEGFVGAFLVTEVFAVGWGALFARWNYMICPAVSLGMNAFTKVQCEVNPVFEWHYTPLPEPISSLLSKVGQLALHDPTLKIANLPWTYFFLHCLVFAAFASLIAPFGGFFASGFKRAFNIKDFGDSIPGHGGLTDRFDCQFLMGLFSYVYFSSVIREHHVTVGGILQQVVQHLNMEEQKELYREVGRYLAGQGVAL
ncbi:phosphatidate cytidylyltransferase [Tilletia horrida]|uniref:Phosphatidate cytidylyltransferase n=1 Tax=Tilletia horrida TaxID=155126 RepID=A0AAN6G5Y5_9BASI|nr:phosphatidate cytidylyltransferase [Tilletia horrida]KAK0523298.1 phosphatidate cytidylyltransferase [Tilletia horrida]KAK0538761.1 phosphatidate cytidylyltransferase [Tilletia horrida]KAK0550345.1 phosphatidate cytidylyltransferase [Tilletia horrida]